MEREEERGEEGKKWMSHVAQMNVTQINASSVTYTWGVDGPDAHAWLLARLKTERESARERKREKGGERECERERDTEGGRDREKESERERV